MRDGPLLSVSALATQLWVDAIRCAAAGHPTSSLSAADLMAVLLTHHLRYDWLAPELSTNDHLVFSKGHATLLVYAMFRAAGVVSEEELVTTYRRFGSRLQGHPPILLPWVDMATGSMGQGLPCAVGIALAGRCLEKAPYHVWVLCRNSEMAEGSLWEVLDKASYYSLANLTVILNVNRLGQRGPTELGWDLDTYRRRVEGFGCRALRVEGHDAAFAERAIAALGEIAPITVTSPHPPSLLPPLPSEAVHPGRISLPRYELGAPVAARRAFGDALKALAACPEMVVLAGEHANSTYIDQFASTCPERFFEMFISEQQLIANTVGLAARVHRPFASTFAAFVSRAVDLIRITAISGVGICINGSRASVEIGSDGPSQMGLEDLALMQAIQSSTVLYPSDTTLGSRAHRGDGRSRRDLLPADDPGCLPRLLRIRRGVPRRRGEGTSILSVRRRVSGRYRCDGPPVPRRSEQPRAAAHLRPGRRRVLAETHRDFGPPRCV